MTNLHKNLRKKKFNLFTKKSRTYESRLNRKHSLFKMRAGPIITVLLGSIITTLPFFTNLPLLPPFGFMIFIAWRFMRPGIWPMWVGLPFGIFDDIFSGAPFGSAVLIWSIAMLVAEYIDSRIIWRDYLLDWIIASLFIAIYLTLNLLFIGLIQPLPNPLIILPQILFSILLYPLVVRFCAHVDAWRLRQ